MRYRAETRKSFRWLTAVAYVAAVAGWIYAVLDTSRADAIASNDAAPVLWVLAHVVVGFAIGRWWAPLLAGFPILFSLPAGIAGTYTETPLWLAFLLITPVLAFLLAVGVALRKLPPWSRVGGRTTRQRDVVGDAASSRAGRFELGVVLAYSALVSAWAYGVLNSGLTDSSAPDPFWDGPVPWVLLACLNFLLGFAVGRWWAVLVFLVPTALAIPAGYEPDGYPEVPIAFYVAMRLGIFFFPLTAFGYGARRLFESSQFGARLRSS